MSIKFENTEVFGWEHAIRGLRNPMNSWERSDSGFNVRQSPLPVYERFGTTITGQEIDVPGNQNVDYFVGPNDHKLMMSLNEGGPVHAKYRRMITVYVDITAPLYFWKELDTYKVGTVANSCSTMHKIHAKEFELDDFSHEHLIGEPYDLDDEPIAGEFENTGLVLVANNENGWLGHCYHTASGHKCVEYLSPKNLLDMYIIGALNACREAYLKTKDNKYWWQMIQLLPSSYNQKRTVMLNYEVLRNIYISRKAHKLDEWREGFINWIKSLPYSELITGEENNEN